MRFFFLLPALAAFLAVSLPATAEDRGREVRVAVMQHDVLHPTTRESGVDIELQVLSRPLPRMPILGSPQAYVSASLNSDGETNFGAVGLVWRKQWAERVSLELQFGYALHDGVLDTTDPVEAKERQLLGSRDLFRTAIGADYRLSDRWSIGVQWDHLSHGNILGEGRNQGIDAAGLRLSRHF